MTDPRNDDLYSSTDRPALPAEMDDEPIMSEGIGGVPDIPDDDRATVGDADDDNVDTGERQVSPNR